MSREQGRGPRGKPFLLAELLAWIRRTGRIAGRRRGWRTRLWGRTLVTALPYLWLLLFFLVPFLIVLKISVSEIQLAMPPYEPLVTWIRTTSSPQGQLRELRVPVGGLALLEFVPELDLTAGISTVFAC